MKFFLTDELGFIQMKISVEIMRVEYNLIDPNLTLHNAFCS